MLLTWLQRRRRRRLLSLPLDSREVETLRRHVWHYRHLPDDQRRRVDQIVRVMVAEKQWVGAGIDVTEAMRLAIAGYAGVLVSGLDEPFFYDQLKTIVVRPRAFRYTDREGSDNPYLPVETRLGEAWHRGPVVLSWRAVERAAHSAENVALHEFAHHLDGLGGAMDGQPRLADRDRRRRWYAVTESEFLRLVGNAQRGEATLLDHYGAVSRAEFFAVATECFFQRSRAMRERHGDLYATLADFYRQEPHRWVPAFPADPASTSQEPPSAIRPPRELRKRKPKRQGMADRSEQWQTFQNLQTGDALFTLALHRMDAGEWEDARRILSALLEQHPNDEEALAQRALALHALGETDAALADCAVALTLDPEEVDALWVRGALQAEQGRWQEALRDLNAAVALSPRSIEPRYHRAIVQLALKNPRGAVRDASEMLAIDPFDADALALRSRAYEALGKDRHAEADRQRARLIDPSALSILDP